MELLKDAPTRPLDDFERDALAKLLNDQELVVDESPQLIRMLGSVRAAAQCTQCHSVKEGRMLGAFSYELVPARGDEIGIANRNR